MGCLVLLILAIVFRGAIIAVLGAIISLLVFLLSLGFWGLILVIILCVIVAALD